MSKRYCLTYETPYSTIRAEADTERELVSVVSERILNVLAVDTGPPNMSLDDAAKVLLKLYRHRPGNRNVHYQFNRIVRAGVELDVIRCYLRDMTIAAMAQWLRKKRDVTVSKSSVGRFCRVLFLVGGDSIKSRYRRRAKATRARRGGVHSTSKRALHTN